MTTAHRRRGKSLHLDLPNAGSDEKPPLSALFLIKFDVKAGYTIAWKRAVPDVDLSDSVEFKSLPSGLHNVSEDLIFFMHGDTHAGVSAFVNTASEEWERNALMIAVGALVPLEYGRLGRSWRHAPRLKEIAKALAADITKQEVLEQYWEANQPSGEAHDSENDEPPTVDSTGRRLSTESANRRMKRRARMKSMSSAYGISGSFLAPMHPALALPKMLHTFGPLIYPLYKAALLRKRILLVNEAPVELACNFVYNISIISNIPSSINDLIPLEPLPSRLQPLFSIGVHDIDEVAGRNSLENGHTDGEPILDDGFGWVACTTDHVLATKKSFYDVLVNIPYGSIHAVPQRAWPSITDPMNVEVKASQRDLRRYRTLRQCQKRSAGSANALGGSNSETAIDDEEAIGDETIRLLPSETPDAFDDTSSAMDEKLIEPMSWSALAYNSFMWWASAGEQRADLDDEAERDAALWRDFNAFADSTSTPGSSRSRRQSASSHPTTPGGMSLLDGSAVPEMAIIGYFHRMTVAILGTLATVVDAQDGLAPLENGQAGVDENTDADSSKDERSTIFVTSEDMIRMGLDVWSDGDRHFVEELLELYWGRHAEVQGGRIECCGVRIL